MAHKKKLADDLVAFLRPFQERRAELAAKPGFAQEVLAGGAEKVRPVTSLTMETVRRTMHLDPNGGAGA